MTGAIVTPAPLSGVAQRPHGALARFIHAYEWIARREMLACAAVLFITLGIRAAILPWRPPNLPNVQDEFSYLLGADTFASGRLVNPPHPMWQHFETFHELMQPVYASKYPPLQSLVLAFGQKFFGQPWAGVFLSAGLMCAAICWMLQGWLTPNWALLGALMFAARVGIFTYWMNSYWGGAVAAIGGALVLGALPRIWSGASRDCEGRTRKQSGHLITLACGLAILMHSRPWEGAVLGASALGVLAWMSRRFPLDLRARCLRSAIPAVTILLASFGAMAYLDYRITGSPFVMPHMLYHQQYVIAPDFIVLPLRGEPVPYRHAAIREFNTDYQVGVWRVPHDNVISGALGKASLMYGFFFGFWPLMLFPLLWPYRLKTIEERATVLLVLVFFIVAIFPLSGFIMHYAAPIVGLLYVRFLQSLARVQAWRPKGKPLGPAVAVIFVALFGVQFVTSVWIVFHPDDTPIPAFAEARNSMAQTLARMPGRQLVLVRYEDGHNPLNEWVWNRADIDGSQTVWARAMNPAQDRQLIQYFRDRQPDRKVWLLDPDVAPLGLTPYSEKEASR
jgi:hypothetical protein